MANADIVQAEKSEIPIVQDLLSRCVTSFAALSTQSTNENTLKIPNDILREAFDTHLNKNQKRILSQLSQALQSSQQSLYLSLQNQYSPERFLLSPLILNSPEEIRLQLLDPNSLYYKTMVMIIQHYVVMKSEEALLLEAIFRAIQRRAIAEELALIKDSSKSSWAELLTHLERPESKEEDTKDNLIFNILILETFLSHQKAEDFIFLSRFANSPEDVKIVKESVEKRHNERQRFITALKQQHKPGASTERQSIVHETVSTLIRAAELSSALMQNQVLGHVLENLMQPISESLNDMSKEEAEKSNIKIAGASLKILCLRFEFSEKAANVAIERKLNQLENPPKKDLVEDKPFDKSLNQFKQQAWKLHKALEEALIKYDDDVSEKIAGLSESETKSYLEILALAPKQQTALLDLIQLTADLAEGRVKNAEDFIKNFEQAFQNVSESTHHKRELETILEDNKIDVALGEMQTDLKSYKDKFGKKLQAISKIEEKKADVQMGNAVEEEEFDRDFSKNITAIKSSLKDIKTFSRNFAIEPPVTISNALENLMNNYSDKNSRQDHVDKVAVALKDMKLEDIDQQFIAGIEASLSKIPCLKEVVQQELSNIPLQPGH